MAGKLLLIETEARGFPLAGTQQQLSEIVSGYGDAETHSRQAASITAVDEVQLAPSPLDCELPRRGHDRSVPIWGYARSSMVAYGRRVATVSTEVAIESRDSVQQRPGVDEALRHAGTAWTGRRLESVGRAADEFWLAAQPDVQSQERALNLRLITTARSREQLKAIESALDGRAGPQSWQHVPRTPAQWGRVVFVNDPREIPASIPADAFDEIRLELDGRQREVRAHVAQRRMKRTDASYLVIVVCGGTFDGQGMTQLSAMLRQSLEHSLANAWLTGRAEQVNDRQAECLAELLDRNTTAVRIEDLKQQLGLLRYAFADELEFIWDFDVDRDPGAAELYELVDRVTRLNQRWQREQARFERLASVATLASTAGLAPARPRIGIPEDVRKFQDEQNLLAQIQMWWRHYRDRSGDGQRVPTLQRPGLRREDTVPRGARKIELHPFRNRPALFSELSASIALTSFMTAASAVFLGVILQKGERSALPMDVLFLFIATFGFLFATLIYANASGRLARHGTFGYESQVEIANRVSEYLGVFPLLIAIPLSVSRFLESGPIPWAVAGLALLATLSYHYVRGASLLERDISDDRIGSDRQRRLVFVPAIAVSMTVALLGQLLTLDTVEIVGAMSFAILSLLMVLLSAMLPERTNPQAYFVDEWDLLSEETPGIPTEPK